MTLRQLIEHCVQQAAVADAEMQLLQRSAWRSFDKGFPLAEGLDHLEFLGLTELRLAFWVQPLRPKWYIRLYRWIFKLRETEKLSFRLCRSPEEVTAGAIQLVLTISRGKGGKTRVSTEPELQDWEEIHVAGINA
jgi:hypothetical protein